MPLLSTISYQSTTTRFPFTGVAPDWDEASVWLHGLTVDVGVAVGVAVEVGVAVTVAVGVGVGVGEPPTTAARISTPAPSIHVIRRARHCRTE